MKNDKGGLAFGCWRVVNAGGNVNNGVNAGFAALNANNDSSNRNTNVGGQVCLTPSRSPARITLPLGKTQNDASQVLVPAVGRL